MARTIPPAGRRGFSLIGVIVVLAVIGLLAGLAIPLATPTTQRRQIDETREEMRLLVASIPNYFWDCRRLPASFSALESNVGSISGWMGPYANAMVSSRPAVNVSLDQDAWNQAYVVTDTATGVAWTSSSTTNSITITSRGPDKTLGTSDDLAYVCDVMFMRRKETTDEIRILNVAITKYNATYLATAPLTGDFDSILSALYNANLLPRPPTGHTDTLRTDGWGNVYVASPGGGAPATAVVSTSS